MGTLTRRSYAIFADYYKFYIRDAVRGPRAPVVDFTPEGCARRVIAEPFVVVIQPERNMTVPVAVEILDARPPLDLTGWDHAVEASLALPSGRLEIHECTGGSVDVVPVAAGTYRLRALFAGLGTLSSDGLDGDDRYEILLWPAPHAEHEVLKSYVDPRAADAGAPPLP